MKRILLSLACLAMIGCASVPEPQEEIEKEPEETELTDKPVDVIEPEKKPETIEETAEIREIIWNGSDVGSYSVAWADSSICTEEALTDWYFNYVEANGLWYGIIIYTDQGNNDFGILGSEGYVSVGVPIGKDEFGNVSCLDTADAIKYIASGGLLIRVS